MGIVLTGCGPGKEQRTEETKTADSSNAIAETAQARNITSLVNDFNLLESVFDNQNYLVVDGKDSSYWYFSRLNNRLIKTYYYKIQKGDSARVETGMMQSDSANSIVWEWKNNKLKLTGVGRGQASWTSVGSDSVVVSFLKLDQDHIRLQSADSKELVLQKISPLSLFLVRSRYDYQHGTRLAFDTASAKK